MKKITSLLVIMIVLGNIFYFEYKGSAPKTIQQIKIVGRQNGHLEILLSDNAEYPSPIKQLQQLVTNNMLFQASIDESEFSEEQLELSVSSSEMSYIVPEELNQLKRQLKTLGSIAHPVSNQNE